MRCCRLPPLALRLGILTLTPSCRCMAKAKASKPILLPHVLLDELCAVCDECNNPGLKHGELAAMLKTVQEAVVVPPRVAFALRPTMGEWYYMRISVDDMRVEEMTAAHYLAFKEKLVPAEEGEAWVRRAAGRRLWAV